MVTARALRKRSSSGSSVRCLKSSTTSNGLRSSPRRLIRFRIGSSSSWRRPTASPSTRSSSATSRTVIASISLGHGCSIPSEKQPAGANAGRSPEPPIPGVSDSRRASNRRRLRVTNHFAVSCNGLAASRSVDSSSSRPMRAREPSGSPFCHDWWSRVWVLSRSGTTEAPPSSSGAAFQEESSRLHSSDRRNSRNPSRSREYDPEHQ